MISQGGRPRMRRVLMVDDGLTESGTAAGRAVRALAEEMRGRGLDVVEAMSYEDGTATIISDAAIHAVFINWSLGSDDKKSHKKATDLLRTVRKRNERVPVFLMADRALAGTITIEVARIADEFVWILEDTAAFVGGRAVAAVERYIAQLLPPFAAALARYDRDT